MINVIMLITVNILFSKAGLGLLKSSSTSDKKSV